ncbi:MAG: class I SAM-dependent methyltransferase [Candidatus Puniceispirillum sp.]|nr:class I SAM-dependent methyltransferase [Candidatus Puniceispirillum sp.]
MKRANSTCQISLPDSRFNYRRERNLLRRFLYASFERQINRAYRNRLADRGTTAQGVFWRSETSQIARFDALLSLAHELAPQKPVTIADIGCGYGAMFDFIKTKPAYAQTIYCGVDINAAMVSACQKKHPTEQALFKLGNAPQTTVDFAIFSGTFNLTHCDDPALWMDYIFNSLERCMRKTRYALVLNLLTAPQTKITQQIFYANRAAFIRRAEQQLGPTYARSTKYVSGDVSFVITRPR